MNSRTDDVVKASGGDGYAIGCHRDLPPAKDRATAGGWWSPTRRAKAGSVLFPLPSVNPTKLVKHLISTRRPACCRLSLLKQTANGQGKSSRNGRRCQREKRRKKSMN